MRRGIAAAMAGRLQGSGPCWLAASGTRYILYPGEFVPQPVGRVKRFSTFAVNSTRPSYPDGAKEQTQPAQKAPARIVRRRASRSSRRHPAVGAVIPRRGWSDRRGRPACQLRHSRPAAASTRDPWSPGGRPVAQPGRRDPARSGAILPPGSAADRDHGRLDVGPADRGVDRVARFAPGVTFSRQARKPIV